MERKKTDPNEKLTEEISGQKKTNPNTKRRQKKTTTK